MDKHHISRHNFILFDLDDISTLDVLPFDRSTGQVLALKYLGSSVIFFLIILLPLPIFEGILHHRYKNNKPQGRKIHGPPICNRN